MGSTPQVCLIDDEVDYRFLIQQVFSRYLQAQSVTLFSSGKAFLDKLPYFDQLPNLVLLDRHMPTLDGHQTLVILKGHPTYKRIPVVMMSAQASPFEISSCYEAGVNSFLSKSLNFEAMREQMKMICQYWLVCNLKSTQIE
jgi:CheY-like chemotaxis protein